MDYSGIMTCDSWKQWPNTPKLTAHPLELRLVNVMAGSDFYEFVILAWVHDLMHKIPVPGIAEEGGCFEEGPS